MAVLAPTNHLDQVLSSAGKGLSSASFSFLQWASFWIGPVDWEKNLLVGVADKPRRKNDCTDLGPFQDLVEGCTRSPAVGTVSISSYSVSFRLD